MRLLFISPAYPLPANNGFNMRTWSALRAFAAEGHRITLLTLAQPQDPIAHASEIGAVCEDVDVVTLPVPSLSGTPDLARRLRSLVSPEPYAVRRFISAEMRMRISNRLAHDGFDAIVCDTYSFVNVPSTSCPILLLTQNVEHVILRRYLAHSANPAKLAYAWMQWRKLKRWEEYVCRRSAVGMVCSEVDRQLLRQLASELPIVVAPNVVDVDSYSPTAEAKESVVLFQGGMDWYPNRDAVTFFVSSVLPKLRSLVPGVCFLVAGRNPPEAFLRRFRDVPDVEFTGTVPDMRLEMARAMICAVPLRIGSGTRIKILEAAAMGKAVVSTTIGAEGLTFVDGQDILIADEPGAFADALARLLRDRRLRQALGRRARRRIEREYGFDNLREGIRKTAGQLSCQAAVTT